MPAFTFTKINFSKTRGKLPQNANEIVPFLKFLQKEVFENSVFET